VPKRTPWFAGPSLGEIDPADQQRRPPELSRFRDRARAERFHHIISTNSAAP